MSRPRVGFGLAIPPKPPTASLGAFLWLARALRYDSLLVWDHLQDLLPTALWDSRIGWAAGGPSPHAFFEPLTVLGALAPRAGRVRLGVAVTDPARRHPVVVAQAMLTLAHLTGRAPILGIGAGERANLEPYGLPFSRPVGQLEEALQIFRLCFGPPGPIDFAGEHFRLHGARLDLAAPPGRTPRIWVGGLGPRMLRLTGRYGDGWYPVGLLSPAEYADKLGAIRAAAGEAGRDPAKIVPALQPYVVVAPTAGEARAMLDAPWVRFSGLLIPAAIWERHGFAHPFGAAFRGYVDFVPERYAADELREAIGRVPVELARAGVLCGTPAEVAAGLREYVAAGARYLVPQLLSAYVSRRAALYGVAALRTVARALR